MSKDPRDKEEEFIAGLAEDTGRDLGQWMGLIDAQTFAHRNDMIDWLRQQGLTFAKASRLERIHHNGGKPVYGDRPSVRVDSPEAGRPMPKAAPVAQQPVPQPNAVQATPPVVPPPAAPVAGPSQPAAATAAPTGDLAGFLARAKGYRPLAELLIRMIRNKLPETQIAVRDTHAELAAPSLFGAIAVTAKDVRLSLDLGDRPFDTDIRRVKLPGMPPSLTHTVVLNDARKIDAQLMELVAAAAARVNS